MLQKFEKTLRHELGITPDKVVLCAVSGGMDSMCLLHLMQQLTQPIAVAHVNYHLRENDSNLDEQLVRDYCRSHQIAYFITHLKIDNKSHLQEKARNLRYNWFQELLKTTKAELIATAHHLDDQLETMMINLIRGTGIAGLTGIPSRRDQIIRPMLRFSRLEIDQYVTKLKIPHRQDLSNDTDDYLRNRIRHHITPLLVKENLSFYDSLENTIQDLKASREVFDLAITRWKEEYLNKKDKYWTIDLSIIPKAQYSIILFHLLKYFGINRTQVLNILNENTASGKLFSTKDYELLKDRNSLIIRPREKALTINYSIPKIQGSYSINESLEIELEEFQKASYTNDPDIECFDLDKVEFPLTLRTWKAGDRFTPLGLHGKHQKVQDFLSNNKVNLFDKDNVLVLEDVSRIIWLIGHRLSEEVKLSDTTKRFMQIKIINKV